MDFNGEYVAGYTDLIQTPIEAEALSELRLMNNDPEFWVSMQPVIEKLLGIIREAPDGLEGVSRRADSALSEMLAGTPMLENLSRRLPEMPVLQKLAYWNFYSGMNGDPTEGVLPDLP